MEKIRKILLILNIGRILPAYFCFLNNKFKNKCKMDLEQWVKHTPGIENMGTMFQLGYILLNCKEYRNVLLNRLHRNVLMYAIVWLLFRPSQLCFINMPPEKIGGGLSLQHGFSTIITAQQIGERCRVFQQVTIGYNGVEAPVIGDDVTISAGAIVIGGVHIENGAQVGAGAVVTHDVPAHATVAGVPARVLYIRTPESDT